MRKYLRLFVTVLLPVMLVCVIALNAHAPSRNATVCALTKDPAQYSQTAVRLRAYIRSDLIHTTLLMDQSCEGVGIALASGEWKKRPVQLEKDENYHRLEALFPQLIELEHKGYRVYGTFEGLFDWNPNGMPPRTLILQRVSKLHVGEQDLPK